ncbi:MAG: T9SS type A sorting domain-containing protein [Caldithrix sp.]|nr:T9SS type A sorting domain-containing protein [Caldithrix sp.]
MVLQETFMEVKIRFILLFCFMLSFKLWSQDVQFSRLPAHLQLFARDAQDSAVVDVKGTVLSPGHDTVSVEVLKDHKPWKIEKQPLEYDYDDRAAFHFKPKINAELTEYYVRVYVDGVLVAARDSIVCGDVFLINGQSNSHPDDATITERNEFWRSFGKHTDLTDYDPADTTWGLSTPRGWCDDCNYAVGVWGFRLQKLIWERYGLPSCIINGGSGGSSISYNLPDSANHMALNTTYGRLLYRATKAGVDQSVKAVLWHQGESDSNGDDAPLYHDRFTELRAAWKADYNPVQKIYVFQIRPGCGGDAQDYLREVQRQFPQSFNDVVLMSTCGLQGHDDCHYNTPGYEQMADWIFRLIARDFYQSTDTVHINPPDIQKAYYTDTNHDQIILQFDGPVSWPDDTLNHALEDHIYIDGQSGYIAQGRDGDPNNELILELTAPLSATVVTYLPNQYYNRPPGQTYQGPWIRNPRGVGALSFHEFPITDVISNIEKEKPDRFNLFQNYPNPFNPGTTISFTLHRSSQVKLVVFNIQGQHVRTIVDKQLSAGSHQFHWDGTGHQGKDSASGVYCYRLVTGNQIQHKKMVLLR